MLFHSASNFEVLHFINRELLSINIDRMTIQGILQQTYLLSKNDGLGEGEQYPHLHQSGRYRMQGDRQDEL